MFLSLIQIGSKTAEKNSAQTNRQTDRQTDKQTDTTKIMITWPRTNMGYAQVMINGDDINVDGVVGGDFVAGKTPTVRQRVLSDQDVVRRSSAVGRALDQDVSRTGRLPTSPLAPWQPVTSSPSAAAASSWRRRYLYHCRTNSLSL